MNSPAKPNTGRADDSELWQRATRDVTPLSKKQLAPYSSPKNPKLVQPVVEHRHTWDLHGFTVSEAWSIAQREIQHTHHRSLLFITGKSGDINREFVSWLEHNSCVSKITPLPSGGAYRVHLKKPQR